MKYLCTCRWVFLCQPGHAHKHRNHYSPILAVLLRRLFKTLSSFLKQQLQNNSDWVHTVPGSTASCCALQSLVFTWCEGPADWVTWRLGKHSISTHEIEQEKLIGPSEWACCVLCQRDRKGTQHQAAAGSTVNLREVCCARVTTRRPLHARSFPHSIHSEMQICQAQHDTTLELIVLGTYSQTGQELLRTHCLIFYSTSITTTWQIKGLPQPSAFACLRLLVPRAALNRKKSDECKGSKAAESLRESWCVCNPREKDLGNSKGKLQCYTFVPTELSLYELLFTTTVNLHITLTAKVSKSRTSTLAHLYLHVCMAAVCSDSVLHKCNFLQFCTVPSLQFFGRVTWGRHTSPG